jgi:1,4-alpha-glucan branching enzyme
VVRAEVPGALMIAEESTSWPAVSRPVDHGGLGFTHKWNMGWMHDTLGYFERDPVHRRHHHRDLTFGLLYAYTERFVLPLSHDEVVHGKRSLFGKMPGDEWQRFANLRALYGWMWAYPGAKLLFAGGELAQRGEWDDHRGIDWSALDAAANRGVLELVRTLNRVVGEWPALQRDHDAAGFQWLDADDADHSVYAFLRWSNDGGQAVACVANLTPVPRPGYRLGVPWEGRWTVLVDSDDARFEGSGFATGQTVEAGDWPHQGQACSAVVDLPPLGVLLLGSPA